MSLRAIMSGLIEEFELPGVGIRIHDAVVAGRPRVLADEDALHGIIDEGLARKLTTYATRQRKQQDQGSRQLSLPGIYGLRERYALDERQSMVKRTEWLTYEEFLGLIDMREAQLIADQAHLQKLREAERTLRKTWLANRGKTFGEVAALHQRGMDRDAAE